MTNAAARFVDISGYAIKLGRTLSTEWYWTATAPNGTQLSGSLLFARRGRAEEDALKAIEHHALGDLDDVVISGDELRRNVRGT